MGSINIKKIPGIKITGPGASGDKVFNGYPFALDYTIGTVEPTKLVISFVSEDGTYTPPKCSVIEPFTITVGGDDGSKIIDDKFYAIKTQVSKTSQGRRLDVTFYDGSIILDRIWVGLHKKMGDKGDVQPPSLIILGSEHHPCDINGDRAFTIEDVKLIEYDNDQDPCKLRCPGENMDELMQSDPSVISNPIVEECRKKNLYQLLEIRYNFAELLYFILDKGIKIITPQGFDRISRIGAKGDISNAKNLFASGNPLLSKDFYYPTTPHTGTIREVLTQWCDELALLFYWEAGGLNFIDIHTRPKIELPTIECVSDTTETFTLEGTVSRGAITYYGREGSHFNNPCPDYKRHELACLTLFDLFGGVYYPLLRTNDMDQHSHISGWTGTPETLGPRQQKANYPIHDPNEDADGDPEYNDTVIVNTPPNSSTYIKKARRGDRTYGSGVPIDLFENSCVCSLYDERLRWKYILYYYYQLKNQTDAADSSQFLGRRMDRFGGMKILKVGGIEHKRGSETIAAINTGMYETIMKNGNVISAAEQEAFEFNKGYFVICELNQKKLTDQFHTERNLAENFLGKHWIKAYFQAFYGSEPQCTPVGRYYAAGNVEMKDLDFTHYFHHNSSRVADLAAQFKKDRKDSFATENDNSTVTSQKDLYHNLLSLLYYEKNPKWSPDINTNNPFKKLIDTYDNILPTICGNISLQDKKALISQDELLTANSYVFDDKDERLKGGEISDEQWNSYYNDLVIVAMYPNKDFTFEKKISEHVDEEDSHYQLVSPDKNGNVGPRLFYGLSGRACVQIVIDGVPIYTPSGMGCDTDYQNNIAHEDPTSTAPYTTTERGAGKNPAAPTQETLGQRNDENATGLITTGLGWDYVTNPMANSYETQAPTFAVVVRSTYAPLVEIKKYEAVSMTPAVFENTLRVEYIPKSINDNNIGPLNAIVAEAGKRKQCTLDPKTIETYHKTLNEAFTHSIIDPYQSNKITVPGVSLPAGVRTEIANGFESVSMRIDDASVVQTTYSFGNSLFKPVSIDVTIQAMQQRLYDAQSKNETNNFFNPRLRAPGKPATALSDDKDVPPSSEVKMIPLRN